ncbi:uncharacterized protein LOC128193806 [Vigna angularis]|uniref:uncharacterized protein LOC128193806 n=1 Tax=Phaseolus angularis TaxID=3914 RepID=UPI0022B30123|nr:uncharacterized protein LOC128193806 [Vigna angularis]
MVFSTLKKTLSGIADNFGESFERFKQHYDRMWFNSFLCHQDIPFSQELQLKHIDTLPSSVSHKIIKKKNVTLALDLDETLVHSSPFARDVDFSFTIISDGVSSTIYVRKRPFLEEFLEKVSEMFEVVIFTASNSSYSAKLLDCLDPHNKIFSQRFYRDSCKWEDGHCLKDLTVLGTDLAKVFIIDNSPRVFRLHVNNGIPIKSWYWDRTDHALIDLLPFLEKLVDVDDVRPIIAAQFGARIHSARSAPIQIRRI